jgi:hypothetical protein
MRECRNAQRLGTERNVFVIVFCPKAREFQQSLEPFLVRSGCGSFLAPSSFLVTVLHASLVGEMMTFVI